MPPFPCYCPSYPRLSVFLCWGKVLVLKGLVWRKSRVAGPFMGVLVSPVVGEKEGGQVRCLPALRDPLFPQLGLQGSGR